MAIAYLTALNRLGHMQQRTRSLAVPIIVQASPKQPLSIPIVVVHTFSQSYPNLNYPLAVLLFTAYIMVLNYGFPKGTKVVLVFNIE